MTELEINKLIEDIREVMNKNPESVSAEWTHGKNSPNKYEVIHEGKTCVFELFNIGDLKSSRLKVDDFQGEYSEGTAIYELISEFVIVM